MLCWQFSILLLAISVPVVVKAFSSLHILSQPLSPFRGHGVGVVHNCRVHPWVSHKLIIGPYSRIWGFCILLRGNSPVLWRWFCTFPYYHNTTMLLTGLNQEPSTPQASSQQLPLVVAVAQSYLPLYNKHDAWLLEIGCLKKRPWQFSEGPHLIP